MFSRKTRKGLLGGVALALAGLMAGEAGAAGGILITSDFCKESISSKVATWGLQQKDGDNYEYENVFYMTENGRVISVAIDEDENSFQDIDELLVVSHGNCGRVAGMSGDKFAMNVSIATYPQKKLGRVLFSSCEAANSLSDASSWSVLRSFEKLGPITGNAKLTGWKGKVTLVGGVRVRNSGELKDAQLTDNALASNLESKIEILLTNLSIRSIWSGELKNWKITDDEKEFRSSLQGYCETMLTAFEGVGDYEMQQSAREEMFKKFLTSVMGEFISNNIDDNPRRSVIRVLQLSDRGEDGKVICGPGVIGSDGFAVKCP